MNGATQTFRRPSVATNPSQTRDLPQTTSATHPTVGAYTPPHMTSNQSGAIRNGAGENRYSKEQLLSLYKAQRESGTLGKNVADYFIADWNPHVETPPTNGAWGKREDSKDNPSGPEICWDHGGQVEPLGLVDMTDDEKEVGFVFVCPLGSEHLKIALLIHVGTCRAESCSYFRLGQLSAQASPDQRHQGKYRCCHWRTQVIHFVSPEPHEQLQHVFPQFRAPRP